MPDVPAATLSPAHVHPRAEELCGHRPRWIRKVYRGGPFRHDHYRTCTYCRSIHPADLMPLLRSGRSRFNDLDGPRKRILITPNPIAGRECRMGYSYGPVFARENGPICLRERLECPPDGDWKPSIGERLAGHFERSARVLAPAMIEHPFFLEHTSEPQWDEILAAAQFGERHASLYRA